MTALPSIASFTAPTVAEGEFKTALSNLHLFLSGLLGTTGAAADAQAALGALLGAGVTTKTGAYTVAAADRGRVIACSGTFTVTLPDATTIGAGFAVAIGNYGSGTITIDPFSSQTLDGAATRTLTPSRMMVVCAINGGWLSVGGIGAASTTEAGVVQLSAATDSTSTTLAATSSAVKAAYDRAAAIAAGTDPQKIAVAAFAAPAAGSNVVLRFREGELIASGDEIRSLGLVTCLVPGVIKFSADLRINNANYSAQLQIFKNDLLAATLSHNGTAYATKTADVGLALGDRVELRVLTSLSNSTLTSYARNVRALSASSMFALA